MKRKLLFYFVIMLLLVLSANVVLAEEPASPLRAGFDRAAGSVAFQKDMPVEQVFGLGINIILQFTSLIYLILVLYAGINWMLDRGEGSKVKKSKSIIIYATIGFALMLLSYTLVNYILGIVEIK